MKDPRIEKLEDIVPIVRRHLLPAIEQAVDVCVRAHQADSYNDNYTFGTQLWRNIWNRINEIATSGDTLIHLCGKANEYKFNIGPFILRHHRVGGDSLLPLSAKSAKTAAIQLNFFVPIAPDMLLSDNLILSIEAEPNEGLKDVFLGELKRDSVNNQFFWEREIPIFTPEELSILKGKVASCPLEEEVVAELRYEPAECEPGKLVSFDDAMETTPTLRNGKADA